MAKNTRYILDTGAILKAPEILALGGSKVLFIPEAVLDELSTRGRGQDRQEISELISLAIAKGNFELIRRAPEENEALTAELRAARLDGADIDIVRVALWLTNDIGPDAAAVVTLDAALRRYLSSKNIQSMSPEELLSLNDEAPHEEVRQQVAAFSRRRRIFTYISFATSVAAAVSSNLAVSKFALLISTFPMWATILIMPALGLLLYGYRQRFRLSYGGAEFLVGVGMTYYVFFPRFDYASLGPVEIIQIVGGLYVMVRGLDNLSKGLEGTKYEAAWRRVFN